MAKYLTLLIQLVLVPLMPVSGQDALCNDKLIQTIPDSHLTSSSSRADPNVLTGPERGRLNTTETALSNGTILMGGWSPATDNRGEYIQAVFDEMTMINSVLTQGRNLGNEHMTSYTIEYTEDGTTWKTVNNDIGVEQIFMGNSDSDTVFENTLTCPIFAKGIRIVPVDSDNHISLRFEVNGCYVDNSAIVVTTPFTTPGIITTNATTVSQTSATPNLSTPMTTPGITTRSTLMTTPTTTPTTTPLTTPTTPRTTPTTPPYVFHPGIQHPFDVTTSKMPQTTIIPGFMPGIATPFGSVGFVPGQQLIG